MTKTIIWSLLTVCFPVAAWAQNQNPADFIMRTVIQRARVNDDNKKLHLTYKKTYVIEELNEQGNAVKTKGKEVVLVLQGGNEKLIEKDEKSVKRGFSSAKPINLNEALATRYEYTMDSPNIIMIDNRAYHVINFKPKDGVRANDDLEEVMSRLEGTIYIDLENLYIYRLIANLIKSYRTWIFFNLISAHLEIQGGEFEKIAVMKDMTVVIKYSVAGFDNFERRIFSYSEYQLVK